MWQYNEIVRDHFENPRNVGEITDCSAIGEAGSLACGDSLKLFLKIEDGKVVDAKFKTFGCASAIASSSALTEMVKGKTVEEVEKITNQDIADFLGGLPKEKIHCSVMGQEALTNALRAYKGLPPVHKDEEGELVCGCFGITDKAIERAIREKGLTTIEEIGLETQAGTGCESCHEDIQKIIDRVVAELKAKQEMTPKKLTNVQKIKMVEEVLEKEIRPSLRSDGGDIELIDVEGDKILVALRGHCATCAASQSTLKDYVEHILKNKVSDTLVVEEAAA